jgi:large subunit ribosomal protein L23
MTQAINYEQLLKIIQKPHISEKSTTLSDRERQYTFKVLSSATKPMIKQAVEKLFDVKVHNVRVLNIKGKRKTFKQIKGIKSNWKKAYVALKEGYEIKFLSTD